MKTFNKTAIFISVIICISCCIAHGAEAQKNVKNLRIGAHFYTMAGLGAAQVLELGENGLKEVLSKIGYTYELKKYSSHEDVFEALMNGEIDGGMMWPSQAARAIAEGHEVLPVLTYTLGNKRKRPYCFWHLNENKPTQVTDIIGKRLVSDWYNNSDLIILRNKLYEAGLDKPLWNVFSSMMKAPSQNAAHMSIAFEEADFYWDTPDAEITLKILSPAVLKKTSYDMCTEPIFTRGSILFNKDAMSDADFHKFKDLLRSDFSDLDKIASYNPSYKGFDFYSRQSKLALVIPDDDEFDTEAELYKKGMNNGWIAEAEYIVSKMDSIQNGETISLKPDKNDCAKICSKSTDKTKCISMCMGS